jgi:cyclohexanecarboxylate-CoA ligase
MRATRREGHAARYRRPGGPWDVGTLDALTRAGRSGGLAVVDGAERLDAPALDLRVASLAGGLRRLGVRRGAVVAWQLPNWWETVVLYRACWRLGAVAAPLHHQAGGDEVARMVEVLRPAVTFSGPGLPLAEVTPSTPVRGAGSRSGLAGLPAGPPVDVSPARGADVALVLFTSGSTGEPKGVLHTHRGLAAKMVQMVGVHGLGPRDVSLMPLPMAHVSGLLNGLLVPAAAGMTTVLMERWDPSVGLARIEGEGVSFMVGPPTLFDGLMATDGFTPERVGSLRLLSTGAMGVSTAFVTEASARLGARVKRTYGATEIPTITTSEADDPLDKGRDTDGHALGDGVVRTVDPATGRDVDPGAVGEVWFRGPEMFAGYLDVEATRRAVTRGWFRTGDLGRLDEGWLRIVGRLKDVIIRGGENISPAEVERVLVEHPSVRQAVVVGYPDDRVGERVAAFVVSDDDFDLGSCREWFADRRVARFKVPERVVRLPSIPLLPAGKPDLARLRRQAVASS